MSTKLQAQGVALLMLTCAVFVLLRWEWAPLLRIYEEETRWFGPHRALGAPIAVFVAVWLSYAAVAWVYEQTFAYSKLPR